MSASPSGGVDVKQLRYLLLSEVVGLLTDAGKTQIQKLVYFLQEQFGFPLAYEFRMYHYGPYSFELDDDLSSMKVKGYVLIEPDPNGYGFHIRKHDDLGSEWGSLGADNAGTISEIVEQFRPCDASDLELRATVHYVSKTTGEEKDGVVSKVKWLKPRFAVRDIEQTYEDMQRLGLLPVSLD